MTQQRMGVRGEAALEEVASHVKPDTILARNRQLIAQIRIFGIENFGIMAYGSRRPGSALHVMLAKRFRATVGLTRFPRQRRSTASDGDQRSVSTGSGPQSKKYGHLHHGKQKPQCHDWGHQFVDRFEQPRFSADPQALIERLLVERMA